MPHASNCFTVAFTQSSKWPPQKIASFVVGPAASLSTRGSNARRKPHLSTLRTSHLTSAFQVLIMCPHLLQIMRPSMWATISIKLSPRTLSERKICQKK